LNLPRARCGPGKEKMAYVNMLETELLQEFAKLLGEFETSKAAELKKIGEEKDGMKMIDNGFVPVFGTVLESKKRNALDAAVIMSFSVASSLEGKEKDACVIKIRDTLLAKENLVDPMMALSWLTNLFNVLDETSPTRYDLYMDIADRAKAADAANWLVNDDTPERVEQFKKAWTLSPSQHSTLLLKLLRLCQATDQKRVFGELLVKYLESLNETVKESDQKKFEKALDEAKDWTVQAVIATFKAPFEMAHRMRAMLGLKVVQRLSTSDPALVSLLKMYVEEDFSGYLKFSESKENLAYMEKKGLSHTDNINNFRVFAACQLQLGAYTYEEMQKALMVENKEDIEEAVMGLVLSKKVDAKIDQANGQIYIRHTSQREFRDSEWPELGTKLKKWKEGVENVLNSLYKARQR